MKKYIYSFCMAIAMLMSFSSCERIDAGHEGILVNLYGSDFKCEAKWWTKMVEFLNKSV